jgi:hypothetical protein
MNIKDLYLAIGELHLEMDNPQPHKLKQKIEVLEQRVQVSLLSLVLLLLLGPLPSTA